MDCIKKQKKNITLLLSIILFAAFFLLQQSNLTAKEYASQDSSKQGKMSQKAKQAMSSVKSEMQKMNKNMMGVKMTGDPDYDFAQMMLRHHQGAVNISKDEVTKGKDNTVKSIAQNVIKDQSSEMNELKNYVKNNKPSQSGMKDEKNMTGSFPKKTMGMDMQDMNKKMQSMEMKGDQDKDYAAMMIMHNQQSIKMAQNYLGNGKDENLKKLAQQIIDKDTKQIDKLRSWQGDNH